MELPVVSVIIPTYKRPDMIERAVESVLKQSYPKIEIIVVDDNGENSEMQKLTETAVSEYKEKIIYLVHSVNKGGSAARNTGWRKASGKYITFLDDDDEIAVTKLESQVKCLESLDDSWGACYTGYRLIKEDGSDQISTENRSGNCYVAALMRTMFMGSGSNLFIRKKVVDEIHGYDETFIRNQDIEFLVRVLEHYKLAYIDEDLLTIYQEGKRPQRTFEQIDGYSTYYLERFKDRIDALPTREREKVLSVISLERCRIAFYMKKYRVGLSILKENKVKLIYRIKYIRYLVKRMITHTSYGFDGK